MRVHVVSDVHGRADALAQAADGADALICLGDLLLFLDYADHGQGIFADLFGPDAARVYVELRTAGRVRAAHQHGLRLLRGAPEDGAGEIRGRRDLGQGRNAEFAHDISSDVVIRQYKLRQVPA